LRWRFFHGDAPWTGAEAPRRESSLAAKLDELLAKHQVKYTRVAGHNRHPENDRCDQMAVAAIPRGARPR
jgi:ribonuclease HI